MIKDKEIARPHLKILLDRLRDPASVDLIQILYGPRQVGKTTLARQARDFLRIPCLSLRADAISGTEQGSAWLEVQWDRARAQCRRSGNGFLLILDEVQKIVGWADTVKYLWEQDREEALNMHVLLLGSSELLLRRGTESLLGRYETLYLPHWSFAEMESLGDWTLHEYLYYGGYPRMCQLRQHGRRMNYLRNSIIEPLISLDLQQIQIQDHATMARVFELSCSLSGRVSSYASMARELGKGAHVTVKAYLHHLENASLVAALSKYKRQPTKRGRDRPKYQVFNNGLYSAFGQYSMEESMQKTEVWGRCVESAVGAHLLNHCRAAADGSSPSLYYWRGEKQEEVDFVLEFPDRLCAIEVSMGRNQHSMAGMQSFLDAHQNSGKSISPIMLGTHGLSLEEFFRISSLADLLNAPQWDMGFGSRRLF